MKMFIALAAALVLPPGPQESGVEAKLRDVVDRFFSALAKKDVDAAMAAWGDKSPLFEAMKVDAARASKFLAGRPLSEFKLTRFAYEDDTASARLRFKGNWSEEEDALFTDEPFTTWSVHFCMVDGAWKWWVRYPAAADLVESLRDAESKEARAELLEKERELISIRLVDGLADEALNQGMAGGEAKAHALCDAAFEAAVLVAREDLAAMAHANIGTLRMHANKSRPSADSFREAVRLSDRSGPPHIAVMARAVLGYVLGELQLHDEAETRLKEARELLRKNEKLGWMTALVQNFSGMALRARGDLHEAARWHARARDTARSRNQKEFLVQSLHELGMDLWQLGDLGGALKESLDGLALADEISDQATKGKLLNSLGLIHFECSEHEEALKRFDEAYALWEPSGNKRMLGTLKNNAGMAHGARGRHEEAEDCFFEAALLLRQAQDRNGWTYVLNNLGLVRRRAGNYDGALRCYQEGLANAEKWGNEIGTIVPICNIAEIHYIRGQYSKAIAEFEKGLAISTRLRSPSLEKMCRLGLGLSHVDRERPGDLEKGVDALEKAMAIAEATRTRLSEAKIQQSYFAEQSPAFFVMAHALIKMKRESEALGAAERAKARTLVDTLAGGRVNVVKAMTPEERGREDRLLADMTALSRSLEGVTNTDERITMEERMAERRKTLEEFRREISLRHPDLQTYRGRFDPATLAEIQSGLFSRRPDLRVLSYLVGAGEVLLFVLSPGKEAATLDVLRIPCERKDLESLARTFWARCSSGGEYGGPGRSLFKTLVDPVERKGLLKGAEHLLIVPDGILHALPFAALQDEKGAHLGEKYALSYAPSVTALLKIREAALRRRQALGEPPVPLMAVGAPDMPKGFSPLKGAEEDVARIARIFGDPGYKGITGPGATEKHVKDEIGKARFVHLATHGKLDETSPMYSFIVLAGDPDNDGRLQARELVDLDLRADLAVLSACETARGSAVRGEGIVGLSWALLVAGARGCIVTHWQVADKGTSELMEDFYRAMRAPGRRVSRAAALRDAQVNLMKREGRAHPFHWAPFILVGDWED